MNTEPNHDSTPAPRTPSPIPQDPVEAFRAGLAARVVGQEEAREAMLYAGLDWIRKIADRQECARRNLLFVGPHGVGAGTLVREAGTITGLPVFEPSLTEHFPTAASGSPTVRPEHFLADLFRSYDRLPETGPLGLVLVRNLEDVLPLGPSSETVQNSLARIFQEKSIRIAHGGRIHNVHSSRILFVATCDRDFLRSAARMGFERTGPRDQENEGRKDPVQAADLIRAGFTSRLVHAFSAPVLLHPLSQEDFRRILALDSSPLDRFKEEFLGWGVELMIAPDAAGLLAGEAARLGTGISGLSAIIDQRLGPVRPWLSAPDTADVFRITVTAEFLQGTAPLQFARGQRRNNATSIQLPFVRSEAKPNAREGSAGSPPLPVNLPSRPTRAGSAPSRSRLARLSDLTPILNSGRHRNKSAKRPNPGNYDAPPRPTWLRGLTAVVESETDECVLEAVAGAQLVIPWEERCRHFLILGKTGSGKTTRVLLPMVFDDLRDPDRTVIVIDAQASETERIVRAASRFRGPNARIIYFNPVDPAQSVRWNPIGGITGSSEAYDLAYSLCSSVEVGKHDSPYFIQQATKYLAALIRGTNLEGKGTLASINELLDIGASAIRQLGNSTGITELNYLAHAIDGGNRNFETSLSEISNVLLPCVDPRVCMTTSTSDFDFAELEETPCVVLLTIPEEKVARLRPILNAFVHRLFNFVMESGHRQGGTLRRPVSLFCDEFASAIGRLPDFHVRANTLRKRGLAITAAVQTGQQIDEVYSQTAGSLRAAFNHHILVPPVDWHDAEEASRSTGMMTVENYVTSDGASVTSVYPEHRPVLTADEIANAPADPVLGPSITFRLAGLPPFLGYLRAAYEVSSLHRLMRTTGKVRLPKKQDPGQTSEALIKKLIKLEEQLGHDQLSVRDRMLWEGYRTLRRGHLPQLIAELQDLLEYGFTLENWLEREFRLNPAPPIGQPNPDLGLFPEIHGVGDQPSPNTGKGEALPPKLKGKRRRPHPKKPKDEGDAPG